MTALLQDNAAVLERQGDIAGDQAFDRFSGHSGPPSTGEPCIVIPADECFDIGSGGQERRIQLLISGQLVHPCRNQRHRWTQIASVVSTLLGTRWAPVGIDPLPDRKQDPLTDRPPGDTLVDASDLCELVHRGRYRLRNGDDRDVGQNEPNGLIDLGSSALSPGCK